MSRTLLLASLATLAACAKAEMTPALRADISAKVQSAQQPITECYQKSLTTNRKLRGMMVTTFALAPKSGQFTDITLRRDEPNDPVLRYCVVQELAKLHVDKAPDSRLVVESVPIRFDWSNP
jgi:hypothetical protein